jgi:hypothetical protein
MSNMYLYDKIIVRMEIKANRDTSRGEKVIKNALARVCSGPNDGRAQFGAGREEAMMVHAKKKREIEELQKPCAQINDIMGFDEENFFHPNGPRNESEF